MKARTLFLLLAALSGVLLVGVFLINEGNAFRDSREAALAIDREIRVEEEKFLEMSTQLLSGDREYQDNRREYEQAQGRIIERQERFVWLSGSILDQLTAQGASTAALEELQGRLNRRSLLVRRFEKRAERYRTECSTGWRASVARFFGGCVELFSLERTEQR